MHVHILGVAGTFMGGIAALAQASGHRVTGSDKEIYPPMSEQLEALGIAVFGLEDMAQFEPQPDVVVIGNVMSRGAPAVEHVLNTGMSYTSGPAWLAEHILRDRWVIAIAGTHGKTTTASAVAWLLEAANLAPGFLIGGVAKNFGQSARLGKTRFFVVEADEYDSAFFDKRSKFVHYRPRTLVLNNLEFDHADIFSDLAAIETQFHHLVRTIPGNGKIIVNATDTNLQRVLERGCWSRVEKFGNDLDSRFNANTRQRTLCLDYQNEAVGSVPWDLPGDHNALNAAAACAATHDAGVPVPVLLDGLASFAGVKRRAELLGEANGVAVYDDFAHHPTAIQATLDGFVRDAGGARVLAIVELRSNTMRMGVHDKTLGGAVAGAAATWMYRNADDVADLSATLSAYPAVRVMHDHDALLADVVEFARPGDQIIVMSNGGFGGLQRRLLAALADSAGQKAPV